MSTKLSERTGRLGIVVLVLAVVAVGAGWIASGQTDLVTFKPFDAGEFVQLLTPLLLVSLFVERAVEVLVSGWREPAVRTKKKRLEGVQARLAELKEEGVGVKPSARTGAPDAAKEEKVATTPVVRLEPEELSQEEERLKARIADYRSGTRRWAFSVGFVLALAAAALGVRALGLFIDPGEFADLREGQRMAFTMFDVVLTAAVLAGGSEGLHQVVETFTGYMEELKNRNRPGGGEE